MITIIPEGQRDLFTLKYSLITLFIRFLFTEFPALFETEIPKLVCSESLRANDNLQYSPLNFDEFDPLITLRKSERPLNRFCLPNELPVEKAASVNSNRPIYSSETVRRFLPLARRRLITSRPALVSILLRKPWSFFLLRFDG